MNGINVLKSHIDYKKDVEKVLRKDNEKKLIEST